MINFNCGSTYIEYFKTGNNIKDTFDDFFLLNENETTITNVRVIEGLCTEITCQYKYDGIVFTIYLNFNEHDSIRRIEIFNLIESISQETFDKLLIHIVRTFNVPTKLTHHNYNL